MKTYDDLWYCEECGIRIAPRWYFQETHALCDNCQADALHNPEYWD